MKKELTCRIKNQPTLSEIEKYLEDQGVSFEYVNAFLNPEHNRSQFWEAVRNDYDLPDFDRWQYFQKIIGTELDWISFINIERIFDNADIDILDLPSNYTSLW